MDTIDGLILLAFAAAALASGWRARRVASRNLEEYFLAGRTLRGSSAGISMAATQFAADTPLLVTGLIATAGIFALWRLWIYALAFLLMGFVLAPAWRRAKVLTDAELAELRYGGTAAAWLRGIKAVYLGTVFNCTVLAMVLLAAVEIAEPFLLWDQWLPSAVFSPVRALVEWVGVPLTRASGSLGDPWVLTARNVLSIGALVAVTTLYSTTGGLRGVVRTDQMQFAVMMLATAGYAVWLVVEAGGLAAISASLRANPPAGLTTDQLLAFTPGEAFGAGGAVLAVFALQWLVQMNADGTGYLAQRSMACRSDADARLAAVVFSVAQILLRSLLWLPIGLALLVVDPPSAGLAGEALRADREGSFVRGMQGLPPGLLGLMLTAMLAALASTIDTHLNWGASYWTHDLYERFYCRGWRRREPDPGRLVWVARLSNLLILLLALGIMTRLSSIQTAWQTSLLLGAGTGVMLVLRWLWWRISARGEIAALLASALLAPLLLAWLPAESEALRLLWMAAGATAAGIGASLWLGPEAPARLDAFYERVRPPGFWAPWDGGAGARRLGRSAAATALAAFSLFAALTGLGTALVGGTTPAWFPWRGPWVATLLVGSAALVPVWWRLGMAPGPDASNVEDR
ncbi:MAG: sodium:solute symporter family transporter [Myxococcota bacterium]